ncbi:MAG: DUF547 domain-containing protein [Chlorobiota bacterium]|nr:MAG: DUF547 domain-containing protein [Chlorobiota bacterium]
MILKKSLRFCLRISVLIIFVFTTDLNVFAKNIENEFFIRCNTFFQHNVVSGLVDYSSIKENPTELYTISKIIAETNLSEMSDIETKAFYINAYNILVINTIINYYPIKSVNEIPGFFEKEKHIIAKELLSLNEIEKLKLHDKYKDPLLHFVLVCGAKGCPILLDKCYIPELLENQLKSKTKLELNNYNFIYEDLIDRKNYLSEIFNWYKEDFKDIVNFINQFRNAKLLENLSIEYYKYDWSLNDLIGSNNKINLSTNSVVKVNENNNKIYKTSSMLSNGELEIKLFNNLYSQVVNNYRSNYHTSFVQLYYGINENFNIGLDAKFRTVNNGIESKVGLLNVFDNNRAFSRMGLTAIGPKVKFIPFKINNLSTSLQMALLFPIGDSLQGGNKLAYLDNKGASFYLNTYFDKNFNNNFSLFFGISSLLDNITNELNEMIWQIPLTAILSYNKLKNISIYWLGELALQPINFTKSYYAQTGAGIKYAFNSETEIEFLYTIFGNDYIVEEDGFAQTLNLGFRLTLN